MKKSTMLSLLIIGLISCTALCKNELYESEIRKIAEISKFHVFQVKNALMC